MCMHAREGIVSMVLIQKPTPATPVLGLGLLASGAMMDREDLPIHAVNTVF